ncbi:MAG: guanylate kinase [Oscillospiraceae bacterium]|nr:guanylate kinase [Oscillospiraceae bacterium]
MSGILLVVSGPSGVGKSTIIEHVIHGDAVGRLCRFSISMTTRAPRAGEIDGEHYFFVDEKAFLRDAEHGMLLEYARYNDHYYGTPAEPVLRSINNGECVILDIETQGMFQVIGRMPEAVTVFVAPPSDAVLEKRLRGRGTEDEERIMKRLEAARLEHEHISKYQYIIINDISDKAAHDLAAIIRAECLKTYRTIFKEVRKQ